MRGHDWPWSIHNQKGGKAQQMLEANACQTRGGSDGWPLNVSSNIEVCMGHRKTQCCCNIFTPRLISLLDGDLVCCLLYWAAAMCEGHASLAGAAMRETNAALEKAREKAAHFKQEAERAAAESASASKQCIKCVPSKQASFNLQSVLSVSREHRATRIANIKTLTHSECMNQPGVLPYMHLFPPYTCSLAHLCTKPLRAAAHTTHMHMQARTHAEESVRQAQAELQASKAEADKLRGELSAAQVRCGCVRLERILVHRVPHCALGLTSANEIGARNNL
eukprot:1161558-Pelagomonas_calceolata.AAC.9